MRFMLVDNLISPFDFTEEKHTKQWCFPFSVLDERISAHPLLADCSGSVLLRLRGDKNTQNQHRLIMNIDVQLCLCCQRCLKSMAYKITEQSILLLVKNENDVQAFSDDDENVDILVVEDEVLNIQDIVEENILMALPISPKHQDCGEADLTHKQSQPDNAFSALANIKSN